MRDVRREALAVAVVASATALAGCGVVDSVRYPYAKESARTIFLDAVTATTAVESLRVSGSTEARGAPPVRFNLLDAEDGSCGGTLSFLTADFDVVLTEDSSYLKGSAGSWQQMPRISRETGMTAARLLADRWVDVGNGAGPGVDARPMCRLVDELLTPPEQKAVDAGEVPENLEVTHKGLSEAAGVKAVKLQVVDDGTASDVWVSVDDPHHILKMAVKEEKVQMEVVLSDFGFPGEVRVPDEDVEDFGDLMSRSG